MAACLFASGMNLSPAALSPEALRPAAETELLNRRKVEMDRLINDHNRSDETDTRETWPTPKLDIPDEVHGHLNGLRLRRFPNEWAVLNAPAIAAIYCVFDIPRPEELVLQLQQLRGVDPGWFDSAFETALFILVSKNPECIPKAGDES